MSRADIVIVNARPWSHGARIASADAVALGGGKVLAVGPRAEIEALAGPSTRRIDARGATVTPGMTDAHLHLVAWARALREIRLEGLDRSGVVGAVAARVQTSANSGTLIGRGWAETGWDAAPDHSALDAVAPDRPVLLHSKDFHALWVNRAAMVAAGVHRSTPDPPGGKIERRPSGEPTGVFREHAVRLFDGLVPMPSVGQDLEAVQDAVTRLLEMGVTAVHDFEGDAEADVLRAMAKSDGPRVRVLMHLHRSALDRALSERLASRPGDEDFAWGALKLFADGTLGSRTAHVFEPYDGSEDLGLALMPVDELKGTIGRAVRNGLSVAVHAIGDRAVHFTLDAFEDCGAALSRLRLPPRIEHAQLVLDEDRARLARLGVVASMQPVHCTADRPLVERFWSTRVRRAYPWRTLLDDGVTLAFGSDAPVEWPSPILGIHAAVTREAADTPGDPFVPMQKISLDDALTAYTSAPARLASAPNRGSLAIGSIADLVIWSADLHRTPPSDLHRIVPAFTLLDGVVRFERAGSGEGVAAGGRREGA
ncbi:MAG TPA: amidohydrolase [Candidatus Eisenbacteria bacterium]|nr:amidohydrolase [Candidatus Eisenbacteria bacterium]